VSLGVGSWHCVVAFHEMSGSEWQLENNTIQFLCTVAISHYHSDIHTPDILHTVLVKYSSQERGLHIAHFDIVYKYYGPWIYLGQLKRTVSPQHLAAV
jgi:hypothetical protein